MFSREFEYTGYDKDSYWVYEDSATHGIDSIAVIKKTKKCHYQSGIKPNKQHQHPSRDM